jgi:hypothetical protein
MPSTGSVNGSARGHQGQPPRAASRELAAHDTRYERAQTRDRVIASLLMCPGARTSGRPNGVARAA